MLEEVVAAYTNNPVQMNLLSLIPYAGGFIIWVYFFLLPIKERKLPIPFWLITFWFAHDSTGALVFSRLADAHDNFWFFRGTSIALFAWTIVEIVGMGIIIKYARQDIWGKYYESPVTPAQAVFHTIAEIVVMLAVVNLLRVFMNDDVMFKWFTLTNAVLAIGPWYVLKERKTREGSSVALLIIIAIIVAQTFSPPGIGMFTTASSSFDTPWFYLAGAVFTLLALWNVITLLRLPPTAAANGRKPIW